MKLLRSSSQLKKPTYRHITGAFMLQKWGSLQYLHHTWWNSIPLRRTWLRFFQTGTLSSSAHIELLNVASACTLTLRPVQVIAFFWAGWPFRPLGYLTVLGDDTSLICDWKGLLITQTAVEEKNNAVTTWLNLPVLLSRQYLFDTQVFLIDNKCCQAK